MDIWDKAKILSFLQVDWLVISCCVCFLVRSLKRGFCNTKISTREMWCRWASEGLTHYCVAVIFRISLANVHFLCLVCICNFRSRLVRLKWGEKTSPCRAWLVECDTFRVLFRFSFMMPPRQYNFSHSQPFIYGNEYSFRKTFVKETKTFLALKVEFQVWTITISWWAEDYAVVIVLMLESWLYWICLWKQL